MVYRKGQDVLIDALIHDHPQPELVERSRIPDGYEKTNIWNIHADPEEKYPARFPRGLAERVVQYYSFQNDVVLDPFAGIGITARAAAEQKRRFCMIEHCVEVADYMTVAAELIAGAIIVKYWFPGTNTALWAGLFLAVLLALNLFSVKGFGEAEFWFAGIKVVITVIFLICSVWISFKEFNINITS